MSDFEPKLIQQTELTYFFLQQSDILSTLVQVSIVRPCSVNPNKIPLISGSVLRSLGFVDPDSPDEQQGIVTFPRGSSALMVSMASYTDAVRIGRKTVRLPYGNKVSDWPVVDNENPPGRPSLQAVVLSQIVDYELTKNLLSRINLLEMYTPEQASIRMGRIAGELKHYTGISNPIDFLHQGLLSLPNNLSPPLATFVCSSSKAIKTSLYKPNANLPFLSIVPVWRSRLRILKRSSQDNRIMNAGQKLLLSGAALLGDTEGLNSLVTSEYSEYIDGLLRDFGFEEQHSNL